MAPLLLPSFPVSDPAKRKSKTNANDAHAKLLDNEIDKRRK